MSGYETLECEVEGGVATLTLNRPECLNAINAQLKLDLETALFEALEPDPEVAVVVLIGAGRAFCAGADIKERAGQALSAAEYYFHQRRTVELFRRIEGFAKPLIAAINGVALGGGAEIALVCDLRLASTEAKLGLPEAALGMIPGAGGTQRLAREVGPAAAKRIIFTGDFVEAEEALRIGLVNSVHPAEELLPAALELGGRISRKAPLAVRFAKRAISTGLQTDIDSAFEYELYAGSILNASADRTEGMNAFVEKRKPSFEGR